jgi:hypothetical protein
MYNLSVETAHTFFVGEGQWLVHNAGCNDHIVLGLRAYGLDDTAKSFGGRTLLSDANWKDTLLKGIADPNMKFTVSLDGLSGTSPYSQVMSAVQRGVGPNASPTNWELAQLYQGGRLKDATFVQGGKVVDNPFK